MKILVFTGILNCLKNIKKEGKCILSLFESIRNIGSANNSEQFTLCMQKALSVVKDSVVLVDSRGIIQYLNKNAENLLKCEQRSVLGKSFWGLYPILNSKTKQPVENLLAGIHKPSSDEYLLEIAEQLEISVEILISPINFLDDSPEKLSYALVILDTSEKKILESKLRYLDKYDNLTRLPNRPFKP